jgi:hypothetical protein
MQSFVLDLVLQQAPVLRYIMNKVCQSEWIFMTSGDSDVLSFGGGTSWEDGHLASFG